MNDIQYGKEISIKTIYNGEVAAEKKQRQKSVQTNHEMLLKEIINSLSLIKQAGTSKLEICVMVYKDDKIKVDTTWQV